jgi:hypothetical protein
MRSFPNINSMGRGGTGACAWVIFGLRKRKNKNTPDWAKKEIGFFIIVAKR